MPYYLPLPVSISGIVAKGDVTTMRICYTPVHTRERESQSVIINVRRMYINEIHMLSNYYYYTRAIHKLILIVHYLFAWISHKISLIRTVYIDSRSSPYTSIANRKTVTDSLLSIFYSNILVYNYCLLLYCITFRLPLAILISLHCFVWTCCKPTLLASVSPKNITCANTPNY